MSRRITQGILRAIFLFPFRPFFRVRVEGMDRIAALSGPVLFIANHHSNVDGPLAVTLFPCRMPFFPLRHLVRRGLYRFPPLAFALWAFGGISVRGKEKGRPLDETLASLLTAIARGQSAFIYPEGKRTRDPVIRTVHRGAPYVALKTGIPVVPLVHDGTCGGFSIFDVLFRRPRITYRFGEPFSFPIDPKPSEERIAEAAGKIRSEIAVLQQYRAETKLL